MQRLPVPQAAIACLTCACCVASQGQCCLATLSCWDDVMMGMAWLCMGRRALVQEMLGEGSNLVGPARDELLHQMMRDQYGNYVVQKTLEVSPQCLLVLAFVSRIFQPCSEEPCASSKTLHFVRCVL